MAVPNLWRTKQQRYRLQAEICLHCEQAIFPPREVCPHCQRSVNEQAGSARFSLPSLLPFASASGVATPVGAD